MYFSFEFRHSSLLLERKCCVYRFGFSNFQVTAKKLLVLTFSCIVNII